MTKQAENRKRQVVAEFRRTEILAAATRVFGARGFDRTRMDDIAQAAGIAKGTVYLYFRSKDTIYQATIQLAMDELTELTTQQMTQASGFSHKLAAFISMRASYWARKQALYRVILSVNYASRSRHRSLKWQQLSVNLLRELFEQSAAQGEIPMQDFEASAWAVMDLIRGYNERALLHAENRQEDGASSVISNALRMLGSSVTSVEPIAPLLAPPLS